MINLLKMLLGLLKVLLCLMLDKLLAILLPILLLKILLLCLLLFEPLLLSLLLLEKLLIVLLLHGKKSPGSSRRSRHWHSGLIGLEDVEARALVSLKIRCALLALTQLNHN